MSDSPPDTETRPHGTETQGIETHSIEPAPVERGAWMTTVGGRAFFLQTPELSAIDIEDIAISLGNLCRFFGHCRPFYSVAQHSVMVSELAARLVLEDPRVDAARRDHFERLAALGGLLHAGGESYGGDIIAPLKRLLPDYGRIMRPIEERIAVRFGLGLVWSTAEIFAPIREAVHRADEIALSTEMRDLTPPPPFRPARMLPLPLAQSVLPAWLPDEAAARFMARFAALQIEGAA